MLIALFGQTGSQTSQLTQSSLILSDMLSAPSPAYGGGLMESWCAYFASTKM